MNKMSKTLLIVMSIIVFVLSVLTLLSDFIGLNFDMFSGIIDRYTDVSVKYIISGVLILISFLGLCIDPKTDDKKKCVNIQGEDGTILITKNTFEEIAISVVKQSEKVKNMKAVVAMKETGLNVNVYMYVIPGTDITQLTESLQTKIKNEIKKITTIEVNNVNVLVKGIYQENKA